MPNTVNPVVIPPVGGGKQVTQADLAFIDAAIQLQRASQAPAAPGPSIALSNPAACDTVDAAAALVAIAVYAYHLYNSCLIGADAAAIQAATKLTIQPTVSLEQLIANRNILARNLGAAPLSM
jgi:hypothetical protein